MRGTPPTDRFLRDARRGARGLLIEGAAGIGKTTLGERITVEAQAAGYRVLGSRASRPDTALSYAVLSDLLRSVGADELDGVPAPQRDALETALLRRPASASVQDPRAVALATLAVIQGLSTRQPVLVSLDDVQWTDSSSARVVGFVLQRLQSEPVGVVATRRTGDPGAVPLDLERAMGPQRVTRVELGPMERAEFGRLMRQRCGPELPHSVIMQIHRLVEGNPFYGQQVGREVLRRGVPEPGQPLPLDPDTFGVVRARVLDLPDDARAALLPVALASPLRLDLLRGVRPVRPHADLEAAVALAEDEGIVQVANGRVELVHPIFASAVTSAATSTQLRAAHRRLADVLEDPEERGRHLALGSLEPDARTADALDRAQESARRRGAADAAAELALLAHRHTPERLEEVRWNRAIVAGMLAFEAGDATRGHALLTEALALAPPGAARADLMVTLCEICWQDTTEVEELAGAAIAEAGAGAVSVAAAHVMLAWVWIYRGDPALADREVQAAEALLRDKRSPSPRTDLLTIKALVRFLQGLPHRELIEEAVELEDQLDPVGPADSSTIYSGARVTRGLITLWAGELGCARNYLEEELSRFESLGRYVARDEVLCYLSHLDCKAGRWDSALRHAEESLDIGEESGHLRGRGQNIVPRAWVSALRGHLDAARRDAEEGLELSVGFADHLAAAGARGVLGFVELSAGDPERAVPHLRAVVAFLRGAGTAEPGMVPFVADALEALVATGRLEEAQRIVADERLMGLSAHGDLTAAVSARGAALLRAAQGDLAGAAGQLDTVLSGRLLDDVPFELGRTLLVSGEIKRRARHRPEARRLLEEAHRQFQGLGAVLWAERSAGQAQRAAGDHVGVLSSTESQVVGLVAEGLTNREVADRLFLSVKTVEANLSRIYRKLGLRSRAELVRHALAPSDGAGP